MSSGNDVPKMLQAWLGVCGLILIGALGVSAATTKTIHLPGSETWVDSAIDVKAGEVYRFQATGEITFPGAKSPTTPKGTERSWRDLAHGFPMNAADKGAVIARIGSADIGIPFLVGAGREVTMPVGGRLYLGINGPSGIDANGEYVVTVERLKEAPKTSAPLKLANILPSFFDSIPRRVSDPHGNPGDRVNFVIVGEEDRLRAALGEAGWVTVDKDVASTILRGALATLSRQAYLTIPMSPLQLFGRPQDYGFAHAEPVQVASQRHHFRIWKAPTQIDGQTVWIGAGTHDVGFDRDQRNNGVTHKIDPDTDKERDYIGQTLEQVGAVAKTAYVTPKDTITKAKTAHGEEFFSDGRIFVIWLKP